MRGCTWDGCDADATTYQVASDGEVWADLCGGHAEALDTYFTKDSVTVLRAWIYAQGGPAAAASNLPGEREHRRNTEPSA